MAQRIPRKCLRPGCPVIGVFDGSYCDEHRRQNKKDRSASRLVTDTPEWLRLRESLMANGNVICAMVDGFGVRCRRPLWGFHHVIEVAARKDLALHQENLVPLCRECHNSVTFGDPTNARYVPTSWSFAGIVAQADIGVLPGHKVTDAQAKLLWTLAERTRHFAKERQ